MADFHRNITSERQTEQALAALKKGANLLKYGRLGKPKFFYFRLCNERNMLIWTSGYEEKYLRLSQVSKIVPGQRTAIFQRYPRPEKECQSFSLIYGNRSLDLICKDREEAEVWLTALRALVPQGNYHKRGDVIGARRHSSNDRSPHTQCFPSDGSSSSSDAIFKDPRDCQAHTTTFQARKWKTLSDIITFTAASKPPTPSHSENIDHQSNSCTTVDAPRTSLSSGVSSSSQGSHDDFEALGDVFIWGECIGSFLVRGSLSAARNDILLPKVMEANGALNVQTIACGSKHAMLVNKRGEIFSWGEGAGGKLGHGTESDVSHPKLIDAMIGSRIEIAACGDNHTCIVTISGDLYTCGDGNHRYGILGHGSEISYSYPKRVSGQIDGVPVSSVSCGPWHTATVTLAGKLFTFGDGTFGALGHGDRSSTTVPREVKTLKELRVIRASCGVWHTAAVVKDVIMDSSSPGKLFTWGDGEKGQLGHGDEECRLVPSCVAIRDGISFCQVACGDSITIGLTTTGKVYTMGSSEYGQLGSPESVGKLPTCIEGSIRNSHIKEISCGSHHVAVLSSQTEVYTWGKGANGQLGHGDTNNRNIPTLVEALKDKQVTGVVCGSNFTAAVGIHDYVSSVDCSICSGCRIPFNFMRKRHNCYNCGLVVCSTCTSKKSLKASLAPDMNKPYRVCDDCFVTLENPLESGCIARITKVPSGNIQHNSNEVNSRETPKFHGSLSKIASFDSVKKSEFRYSNYSRKLVMNSRPPSPTPINGSFQWGSFQMSRALSSVFGKSQKIAASAPGSRLTSRATSPVSTRSSPCSVTASSSCTEPLLTDVTPAHSKQINNSLTPQILIFRSQVELLTRKSQVLEAELERTSAQLKEVSAVAQGEAEKNKAAKEALRSLTKQLREMAERAPEESAERSSTGEFGSTFFGPSTTEKHSPTLVDHMSGESTVAPVLSVWSEETSEKEDFMVKDGPGIYLTLSSFPGGGNHFKQVQISQKHFSSELEAEKWWEENISRLSEQQQSQQ